MNQPAFTFTRVCRKCNIELELDDFAIDTHTCQNKQVFFFKCPLCEYYTTTAMASIPQDKWKDFIPAEKLTELEAKYEAAQKTH